MCDVCKVGGFRKNNTKKQKDTPYHVAAPAATFSEWRRPAQCSENCLGPVQSIPHTVQK